MVTLRLVARATSAELSGVEQSDEESHVVMRWLPPIRIEEPGPAPAGTKFAPCTSSVKPPAAPAVMLDGSSERMVGCAVMVTAAEAVRLVSSALVATTLRVLGDGIDCGSLVQPGGIDRAARGPEALHAAPVIVQVTC